MDSKSLQELLDSLDEGLLGTRTEDQWERSFKFMTDNPMKRPEIAEKISQSKTGKKRSKALKDKVSKTTRDGRQKGTNNNHYGKGDTYKVTTPEGTVLIGTCSEISNKFNILAGNVREYALRGKPCTKGKFKGFLFEIVVSCE